ncbi:MAG TPA: VOC family protein [Microlunatus sp.]
MTPDEIREKEPTVVQIGMTLDCRDPAALARFWSLALGYVEAPPPEGWQSWEAFLTDHDVPAEEWNDGAVICDPGGVHPSLSLMKVPEPKRVKNRLHLDLKVSGGRQVDAQTRLGRIETKVAELEEAGGTVQERFHAGGRLDHVLMLDPEGNEFCVV